MSQRPGGRGPDSGDISLAVTDNTELRLVDRSEWVCDGDQGVSVSVSLGQETLELITSGERKVVVGEGLRDLKFSPAPSEATRKVFQEELENCNQLIELGEQMTYI